jgi:DcmR-like sensory protein
VSSISTLRLGEAWAFPANGYHPAVQRSWNRFVHYPAPPEHAVQVYRDVDELAATVSEYLAAGFEQGEPAVIVAAPGHWSCIADRLEQRGWGAKMLQEQGLVGLADAEATLAATMIDGKPSPTSFDRVVGRLLDGATTRFPHKQIRVFGEMVDLLVRQQNHPGAIALEDLWHRLLHRRRGFSLLCAYHIDLFDQAAQVALLPAVCRTHSHVLPADDPERLHRAVDAALEETLGSIDAGRVYAMIADQIRQTSVPASQLALMWVSAEMPAVAQRVLSAAQTKYLYQAA